MQISETLTVSSAEEFAIWLEMHGQHAEIWVVIYKKNSGKQTVTLHELGEVAMCYGWVDSQSKSIDQEKYALRFTPRRKKSHWTTGNRALARRLIAEGRMRDTGRAALPADFDQDAV